MNRFSLFLAALAACAVGRAGPGPTVIDDFDTYSSEPYIQNQNARWQRFGSATSDGLYSIEDGARGRGAQYDVNWASGPIGYVRHVFEDYLPLFASGGDQSRAALRVALDLAIAPAHADTRLYLLVADGDTEKRGTTIFRTRVGQTLTAQGYAPVAFVIEAEAMERVSGAAPLAEVLANLSSVTFQFVNESGAGAQVIRLDNLALGVAEARR